MHRVSQNIEEKYVKKYKIRQKIIIKLKVKQIKIKY